MVGIHIINNEMIISSLQTGDLVIGHSLLHQHLSTGSQPQCSGSQRSEMTFLDPADVQTTRGDVSQETVFHRVQGVMDTMTVEMVLMSWTVPNNRGK